jgi:hypothetical protein
LIGRQTGIEKDSSTALGKTFFANPASQQTGVVGTVGFLNVDISFASYAVFRALFILAAKPVQVVHDRYQQ